MLQGSVPVRERTLNNEVAYMMINAMDLALDIRLTGIHSAAHLNGRKCVIRGQDPKDHEPWKCLAR